MFRNEEFTQRGKKIMGKVPGLGRKMIIKLCKFYQAAISPHLSSACRFTPSCSQYAIDAAERLPFWSAVWHIVARLSRCHPFAKGGFDPVKNTEKSESHT